jgi:hypothetical protein
MVEFALSLDSKLLRQRDNGRSTGKLQTRSYLRGKVPDSVLSRRKIGFSMPIRRWVLRDPGLMKDAARRLHRRGILRQPRLGLVNRMPLNNEQTWSLLVLDRWLTRND